MLPSGNKAKRRECFGNLKKSKWNKEKHSIRKGRTNKLRTTVYPFISTHLLLHSEPITLPGQYMKVRRRMWILVFLSLPDSIDRCLALLLMLLSLMTPVQTRCVTMNLAFFLSSVIQFPFPHVSRQWKRFRELRTLLRSSFGAVKDERYSDVAV